MRVDEMLNAFMELEAAIRLRSSLTSLGRGVTVGVAVGVGLGVPTSSLSVKASCWDVPLIATRPSTHEETCLVAIAEP